MLYELIAVVRPGRLREVRDIARATSTQILASRGVIRGITNWGTFMLPKPMPKTLSSGGGGGSGQTTGSTSPGGPPDTKYHTGHYFILRFDSSAKVQHHVRKTLGLDPRLLRYSIVNMGGTKGLEDIKDVGGRVESDGGQGF